MDPSPSVNKIFSLIIQEERQQDVRMLQSSFSPIAFNIRSNNDGYTNNNGNKSCYNSNYKNNGNKSPFCTNCKRTGHTQENCYRMHGFPPGY